MKSRLLPLLLLLVATAAMGGGQRIDDMSNVGAAAHVVMDRTGTKGLAAFVRPDRLSAASFVRC